MESTFANFMAFVVKVLKLTNYLGSDMYTQNTFSLS